MVLIRRLVEPAKGGEILFIQARVDKKKTDKALSIEKDSHVLH